MMRFFQIFVLLFWLGSMGWLTKSMLTPDEAGMVEVDPRRPANSFFELNDTTRLILFQNGKRLGDINFASRTKDEEGGLAGFQATLMLNGDVEPNIVGTLLRGQFQFNDDLSIDNSNFLFRMPSSDLKVLASANHSSEVMKAEVTLGGSTIFSFDGNKMEGLPAGFEEVMKNNKIASDLLEKSGDPDEWQWKIEAFRGKHRFEGKRLPVYLIRLSMDQTDQTIRIYLSESGEPLKIDTDLGYQALSELLAPTKKVPYQREIEFLKNQ